MPPAKPASMRTLILDIETAPNLAHVWSLWKQNVGLNQLIVPGYNLCFAAKWEGEPEIFFERVSHKHGEPTEASRRKMLDSAHALLSEADAVVTYYGSQFDIPKLNAEFIELGYKPPAPFQQIDLKLALSKRANWPSHKLQFVAERLGIGSKVHHEGHDLWKKVMADEPAAWKRMERYNVGDVRLTERLYHRVLPWIPSHPNRGLFIDTKRPVCPHCASPQMERRGTRATLVGVYARYQCFACGAWSRGKHALKPSIDARAI